MKDSIEIIINDLQFYNSQLEQLQEIFVTVFKWFEDNNRVRDTLSADFADRLYILTETHKRMTGKVRDNLEELWNHEVIKKTQ